jgi:hypothetical protein
MTANRGIAAKELTLPLATSLIILGVYVCWAIFPPSQTASLLMLLSLSATAIYAMCSIKESFPVILFILYSLFFTLSIGTPDWDARSIWLFHAKRIFYENSLYAQLDGYASFSHNDYPVIFGVLAATLAKAVGHWNEVFPKSVVSFLLLPPLLVCTILYKRKILVLLYIFGIGVICRNYLFNGYQDALVAVYVCTIVLILMYLNSLKFNNSLFSIYSILLLFAFSSILVALKNEGLANIFIILPLALFLQIKIPKSVILIALFATLLLYFFIWKWPVIQANITNDLISAGFIDRVFKRLGSSSAIFLILAYFVKYCGIYFVLLMLNFLRKGVAWVDIRLLTIYVFTYIGMLLIIYLGTPSNLEWHLGTSFKRAILPINVTILGAFLYTFRAR